MKTTHMHTRHYFLFSLTIFLIGDLLTGQSVQDLQVLQRLLNQTTEVAIPEGGQVNTTNLNKSIQTNQTHLTKPRLKYSPKRGEWKTQNQYLKWLQETNGDTTVMELYGFIPDTSLIHFGYNIFSQRDSISFWQNLPVPDNYILGSGDKIEISLWGEAQLNNFYTINERGNVYIERIGLLELGNKSAIEAIKYIENKFKQNFATLRGKYPSSFIGVNFNQGKTINVHFVGEVNIPGIHLVHPFSSIVTSLMQAGGVKTSGSLRFIKIMRDNRTIAEIDLYDYILNGNLINNIQLRENDVIVVPIRNTSIEIVGAVHRSGIYESKDQETISQLIKYSGGLTNNASESVTLQRILPFEKRSENASIVNQFLFKLNQLNAIFVQDGDKIQIHSINKLSNEIKILGQVKRAGVYKYTQDMNLKELFKLAGGLQDSIYIKTMYLEGVEIIRKNEDSEYNETIRINVQQHLEQKTLSKIKLLNNDLVVVRKNKNLISTNNVTITGEVYRPGVYALKNENESIQSIINRAGGVTNKAFMDGIRVTRGTLNVIWDDLSLALTTNDSIFIGTKPGVVTVIGEVYNPGLITYERGRSLNSYIKSAGGLTPEGNQSDILMVCANGNVVPNWLFFHPRVKEGATIIVNKKPDREPFSLNQFLRDTASIAASIAMIYYVVTK